MHEAMLPDVSLAWYESLFLVGSHSFAIPGLLLLWFHWEYDVKRKRWVFAPYLIDFTVVLVMVAVSTTYHWCHANWGCVEDLAHLQQSDHTTVYIAMFWLYLTTTNYHKDILYSALVLVIGFYIVFGPSLVNTSLIPVALGIAAALLFLIGVVLLKFPIQHYDVVFSVIFLTLFGIGLYFQYSVESVYAPEYWWKHGIWHQLSFLALDVAILVRRGFSFGRLLGLPPYIKVIKTWEDEMERGFFNRVRAWEVQIFPGLPKRWEAERLKHEAMLSSLHGRLAEFDKRFN